MVLEGPFTGRGVNPGLGAQESWPGRIPPQEAIGGIHATEAAGRSKQGQ